MKLWAICGLLAAALFWAIAAPAAHEVPSDVRIQVFLKPEGQRLRLLVRAPLASMNDISWPTSGIFLNLTDPEMATALAEGARDWIADRIEIDEDDVRLDRPRLAAVRVSLPSDISFDSYEGALRSLLGPALPGATEVARSQAMVDAMFEYAIRSDRSRLSIDPHYRLLGLRALTVLRFMPPDGAARVLEFHDDPGLVRLDPGRFQAVRLFVVEGAGHIVSGIDHWLVLLCLAIPVRRFRPLLGVVTAFTVAHAITLIASAYGMGSDAGWLPPLVETLTAASIVYLALENILAPSLRRRWLIAFGVGLVHGLGFAFALRDTMQLAGSHLLTSLLSFNLGVEIGQLAVVVVLVRALALWFRVVAERPGAIVLSAIAAHTGWHWMIDRGHELLRYQVQLPDLTLGFFAGAIRWLMVVVSMAAAWWLGGVLLKPGLYTRIRDGFGVPRFKDRGPTSAP